MKRIAWFFLILKNGCFWAENDALYRYICLFTRSYISSSQFVCLILQGTRVLWGYLWLLGGLPTTLTQLREKSTVWPLTTSPIRCQTIGKYLPLFHSAILRDFLNIATYPNKRFPENYIIKVQLMLDLIIPFHLSYPFLLFHFRMLFNIVLALICCRCSLDLYPEENTWHYITAIPTLSDKIISFGISVVINGKSTSFLVRLLWPKAGKINPNFTRVLYKHPLHVDI